jgi:acetyl esterase/lipase
MFEKSIVYSLPGMECIAPCEIHIERPKDGPILADLYMPPNTTRPSPVVIFIHGGIPEGMDVVPKDGAVFVSWAQVMAASGLAGITFNHRMRWNNGFVPGSLEKAADDLRQLTQYLRDAASALNIDGTRMALVAFSAGGPMLAGPMLEKYPGVRCLVALYAYLGDTTAPDAKDAARYSAIGALNARGGAVPPLFLAKAGKDFPMMNDFIDAFAKRAGELGTSIKLATHPEGLHGFDTLNDDDTSRAIIRQIVEFISSQLRGDLP